MGGEDFGKVGGVGVEVVGMDTDALPPKWQGNKGSSVWYVCMYVYLGLRASQHLRSLAPVVT